MADGNDENLLKTPWRVESGHIAIGSPAAHQRLVVEVFGGFRGVFWRCTNDCDSEKMEMRVGIGKSTKILSH